MAQPCPLPFPIAQIALTVLSGQWTVTEWMPTTAQCQADLDADFWRRVDLACLALRANYHGREIDACYEQGDGDQLMVAILRRGAANVDPQLAAAIKRNWADRSTFASLLARYAHLTDRQLAASARQELVAKACQLPLPLP